MIELFWTILFCDGSQAIAYVDPADRLDMSVVYGYVQGASAARYIGYDSNLYVCGEWTLEEAR